AASLSAAVAIGFWLMVLCLRRTSALPLRSRSLAPPADLRHVVAVRLLLWGQDTASFRQVESLLVINCGAYGSGFWFQLGSPLGLSGGSAASSPRPGTKSPSSRMPSGSSKTK